MKCKVCDADLPEASRLDQRTVACKACGAENSLASSIDVTKVKPKTAPRSAGRSNPEALLDQFIGNGAFRIDSFIAAGGMGRVYRGEQLSLGRDVAIKVLPDDLAEDPEFVERFKRESQTLAQLEHPNIVRVYDAGQEGQFLYLVMALLSGPGGRAMSLHDLIQERGPLTLEDAAGIIDQAASALEYAHGRGIIHRDVKPSNFLIDSQQRVLLADFGLAGIRKGESSGPTMTMQGAQMGSEGYMAPEQRRDASKADHRSDIYALGVVLYELLVGEKPDFSALMAGQDAFRWPSQAREDVPTGIDQAIRRVLDRNPEARYQSAGEFAKAVRAAIHSAEPVVPVSPPHGRKMAYVVGSLALLVAVGVFFGPQIVAAAQSIMGGGKTDSAKKVSDNKLQPLVDTNKDENKPITVEPPVTPPVNPPIQPKEPQTPPTAWDLVSADSADQLRAILRSTDGPVIREAIDKDGNTLLTVACRDGRIAAAGVLLDEGASVAQQANKLSALRALLESRSYPDRAAQLALADRLIFLGADVNWTDSAGQSAIHNACLVHDEALLGTLLRSKGVNPKAINSAGQTALCMVLADAGLEAGVRDSMVRRLTDRGWALDCKDAAGNSILHMAAKAGDLDQATRMVQRDGQVDVLNNDGQTPLHVALLSRQGEVAQMLLRARASVTRADASGNVALHQAALGGDLQIVQTVFNEANTLLLRNKAGRTPAEEARNAGQIAIADWLDSKRPVPPAGNPPVLPANFATHGTWNGSFVASNGKAVALQVTLPAIKAGEKVTVPFTDSTGKTVDATFIWKVQIGSPSLSITFPESVILDPGMKGTKMIDNAELGFPDADTWTSVIKRPGDPVFTVTWTRTQ